MVLDPTLRQEIVDFLVELDTFQSDTGRRAILLTAGLDNLLPNLTLQGKTSQVMPLLMDELLHYGSVPGQEQPALICLLQAVKTQVGKEKQTILQDFCDRLQSTAQPPQRTDIMTDPSQTSQVFLCYAREDAAPAKRLYDDLKAVGLLPWMDTEDLLPGQKWRDLINEALKRSSYVVILLSKRALSKQGFIQNEMRKALDVVESLPPDAIFVIPVRLDDCLPADERLQELQWVDLFPDYDAGFRRILRVFPQITPLAPSPPPLQETQQPKLPEQKPPTRNRAKQRETAKRHNVQKPSRQHPKAQKTAPKDTSPLQILSFETVLVNAQGKIIKREPHTAQQYIENLSKGVTLEMMAIPGGTFLMGSPGTESGRSVREGPQHQVTIAPFLLGKYPVTQAQWDAVMGNNPSCFQSANQPVEQVSWHDIQAFLQRLNARVGKAVYRLPTEAEREYACRAGTTTPFSCGETITTDLGNYNGTYPPYGHAPQGAYREQPTDVGSFPPNIFGVYDLHGNVWEGCQDGWHDTYRGAPTDGTAWESGSGSIRVMRGGSWDDDAGSCRSAARGYWQSSDLLHIVGFRLVRMPL